MTTANCVTLAVMLAAMPAVADGQGSSSERLCASRLRPRVEAWRAAHSNEQANVVVLGIDSLDTIPQVVDRPPLQYPREAQSAGYEGRVIVVALVDQDGKVSSADVLESRVEPHIRATIPSNGAAVTSSDLAAFELRRAAVDVVKRARYRPGFRNGRSVTTLICVPIDFMIRP